MRISYAIELVAVAALGLALMRSSPIRGFDEFANYPRYIRCGVYFTDFVDPFCSGLVLVEGAVLWIEIIRRKKPLVWGVGRLALSLSFLILMLHSLEGLIGITARWVWVDGQPSIKTILVDWWEWSTWELVRATQTGIPLYLAALLITCRAARWFHEPSPDLREWVGRFYFGSVFFLYAVHTILG